MPIYIGKAILDLTKHLMYDFFVNVIMKDYPNAKLLYMDTDSFIIEIPDTVGGLSNFVLGDKEYFGLSECGDKGLPLYHHLQQKKKEFRTKDGYDKLSIKEFNKLFIDKDARSDLTNEEYEWYLTEILWKEEFDEYINYGVPGKFKSETKWFSLEEFGALRPKQYSYITENDKHSMRAKGLTKDSVKRYLTHQRYADQILKDEKVLSCKMSSINSKNFKMYTQYIYKRALVNYENKRYWLDSIYSLPYGHPWIQKIETDRMKIEDVVAILQGEDKYTYELNAYKLQEEAKQKNEKLNNIFCMTNLNKDDLDTLAKKFEVCANPNVINSVLSNVNALAMLKDIITGEESIEEEFDF